MAARASTCLVLGLLLTGCPFALDDDYFIDEDAGSVATVPEVAPAPPVPVPVPMPPHPMPNDAAPPPDAGPGPNEDCTRKIPCLVGYECRGKDCEKTP